MRITPQYLCDPRTVLRQLSLSSAVLGLALTTSAAAAADLSLSVEVPRLDVVEYHRPYVAMWIERKDQTFAGHLAVWYDVKKRNNEGTKWLKDLRQWWRRGGRTLELPIDGLSGATHAAGKHPLAFTDKTAALASLPPGEYRVAIEAAREVGGREIVYLPFAWPPSQPQQVSARGETELGELSLEVKP